MYMDWYKWLKNEITSRLFHSEVECSFMHGQVLFAYISEMITEEQKEELCNMIPDY